MSTADTRFSSKKYAYYLSRKILIIINNKILLKENNGITFWEKPLIYLN